MASNGGEVPGTPSSHPCTCPVWRRSSIGITGPHHWKDCPLYGEEASNGGKRLESELAGGRSGVESASLRADPLGDECARRPAANPGVDTKYPRPRLLDLFCGAGGAAMGYARAGFEVVGVDIKPQPNYPFTFFHADALEVLGHGLPHAMKDTVELALSWQFDAIHASPPCQAFTVYGNNKDHVRDNHPDLIEPTRELLKATGLPYVIENVPGAPLEDAIKLCGTSFGLEVRRHRLFESNIDLLAMPCAHGRFTERKYPGSSNRPNGRTVCNVGEWRVPLAQQKEAMGIDWMTLEELSEAIPPAYTEFIGTQLLAHVTHPVDSTLV